MVLLDPYPKVVYNQNTEKNDINSDSAINLRKGRKPHG
jgi:hypothetical protein